jgi:hypothetical protein
VAVALTACIRCGGVELDGKKVYLVGTTAQQRVEDGRLRASRLYDTARGFAGENAANSWITAVRGVRVELLVKVPPKPRWQVGDKTGLALEIVGYRVYSPCSGAVIVANPPSGALPPDKKACGKEPPVVFDPETPAEAVETLSPEMVHDALKPVVEAANTCFAQLNIAGKAKLEITIAGDGTIAKYDQTGDFKSTPTGDCIDRAMTKVRFPPSKKPLTKIGYPLILK